MPTKPRGVKIAQRAAGKSLVRSDGGRRAGSGNTGGGLVSLRSMGVPLVPLPPRRADASYHLRLAGKIFLFYRKQRFALKANGEFVLAPPWWRGRGLGPPTQRRPCCLAPRHRLRAPASRPPSSGLPSTTPRRRRP